MSTIKEYSVIERKTRVLLCHSRNKDAVVNVYMEPITEEQEEHLDKYIEKEIFQGFENCNHQKITSDRILAYGIININKKKDIRLINSLDIINDKGFFAISSFDYENGTVHTTGEDDHNVIEQYQCWDKLILFKQQHCKINKANRIIIYKEIKPIRK